MKDQYLSSRSSEAGEWITNRLDDATITAEPKYSVNITKSKTKICLSLHYKTANSFLHANGVKIQHVTAKDSEIKPYPLCLGNTLKDFTVSNMKQKKTITTTTLD